MATYWLHQRELYNQTITFRKTNAAGEIVEGGGEFGMGAAQMVFSCHSPQSTPFRNRFNIPTISLHPRTATNRVMVPYQTTQAQTRRCQKLLMRWRRHGSGV